MKKDKDNKSDEKEKPKLPTKKPSMIIEKPTFNINNYKKDEGYADDSVKDKPIRFIPLSDDFAKITGLPGVAMGYVQLYRGYTNTGKSTAVYEGVKGCQQIGVLPIIIDTETNWSWEHAKEIGIEFKEVIDEETGEVTNYEGFFIYVDNDILLKKYGNYDYAEAKRKKDYRTECAIEDVAYLVDDLLEEQNNGKLNIELCFFWDSIGSIDCFKGIVSKSKNNMWNAGALESSFKAIFNHKIPSSRKEGKVYTNTFAAVQKIWIDSMQGAGVIKHKGGEAAFYAARLIVHFGGIASHGTKQLIATSNNKQYGFGIETNIKVIKNQVNGLTWEGKIASTPHGFINPENKLDYLAKNKKYLLSKLELEDGEIELTEEITKNT